MTTEEIVNLFVNNHKGHKNGITRAELVYMIQQPDRDNRDWILELWELGYFVINDMCGDGYYLVDWDDPEDVRRFIRYRNIRTKATDREIRKLSLADDRLSTFVADVNHQAIMEDADGKDE